MSNSDSKPVANAQEGKPQAVSADELWKVKRQAQERDRESAEQGLASTDKMLISPKLAEAAVIQHAPSKMERQSLPIRTDNHSASKQHEEREIFEQFAVGQWGSWVQAR